LSHEDIVHNGSEIAPMTKSAQESAWGWSTRKYMNMAPLYAQQTSTSGTVA
jgi:hypothetical protein